ncbi:MAG: protein phosphatase 2C domain-containing protein [Lachnospiraceae bacterium]|nr:protein phosphatase 2C domain-containing protein [Lachnospiraceae bacterium]
MKLKRVKSLLIVFALACMLAAPALTGCSGGETDVQTTEQTVGETTEDDQTEQTTGTEAEDDQTEQIVDAAAEDDETEQTAGEAADDDAADETDGAEAEDDQTEQIVRAVTEDDETEQSADETADVDSTDDTDDETGTSKKSVTDMEEEDAGTDDENSSENAAEAKNDDTEDREDEPENKGGILKNILFAVIGFVIGFVLALVIVFLINRSSRKKKTSSAAAIASDAIEKKGTENPPAQNQSSVAAGILPDADRGTIGKVHNVGCRRNQQDTVGFTGAGEGLLAVVSDGMGGLSDGEKVSQQAVKGMFQAAERVNQVTADNPLYEMLASANAQVLRMLGPDKVYKSGATLLAVYTDGTKYHWIAVGDSRIYLYCGHHLLQVNSEHIYKRQLIRKAVNKKISFATVKNDPQRDRLVSFLGMGDLEEIDGSLRPAQLQHGDKLLLMSDGVFNAVSEKTMLKILESTANAAEAAVLMEKQVLAAGNPRQDNFTCLILDF